MVDQRAWCGRPVCSHAVSNGDIRVISDKLDVDHKGVVLDALIDRIVVQPARKPGRFETDRIDILWRA